jgi:23S rRNA G2445 N2-methylase RlmL
MKGLAITNIGIEDACSKEITDILGENAKPHLRDSCVEFEFEKYEDLFLLCYKAQSVLKIMLLFDSFKIKSIDDIKEKVPDLSEWISKDLAFVARCRNNNDSINTMEAEREVGGLIISKTEAKVSFKNPDVTFFIFINNNNCHIGIDFSGEDLGKRDYRLFTGSDTIKATVAYSLLRLGDFKDGETLLDPFCFSGAIPIEAALFASNFPVNHFSKDKFLFVDMKKFEDFDFDSFFDKIDEKIKKKIDSSIFAVDESVNAVTAAKKNAKIAGINKILSFSRKETDWLELKFKKETIDKIITHPPEAGRRHSEKAAAKIYDELFWQAEHMMKKTGKIVTLTTSPALMKAAAKARKFNLIEERKIMQGKMEFSALVFQF